MQWDLLTQNAAVKFNYTTVWQTPPLSAKRARDFQGRPRPWTHGKRIFKGELVRKFPLERLFASFCSHRKKGKRIKKQRNLILYFTIEIKLWKRLSTLFLWQQKRKEKALQKETRKRAFASCGTRQGLRALGGGKEIFKRTTPLKRGTAPKRFFLNWFFATFFPQRKWGKIKK